MSDHHAQFLIIPKCTRTQKSKNNVYKGNFKHFRSKKFITDLERVNWDSILNVFEANVNKSSKNFIIKLQIYLTNMSLSLSLV